MKIQTTKLIHTCLSLGLICFAGAAFFLNRDDLFFDASLSRNSPFNPIFPVLALVNIVVGILMYKKQVAQLDPAAELNQKFSIYQTAFIIRCAFTEAASLLNIVAFFNTKNLFFLCFAGLAFFALLMARPGKSQFANDFGLSEAEIEQF